MKDVSAEPPRKRRLREIPMSALRAIRELTDAPLARLPEREGLLLWTGPRPVLLAVAGMFLVSALLSGDAPFPAVLLRGVAFSTAMLAVPLFLCPMLQAALLWAPGPAAASGSLTDVERKTMVWGRTLNVLLPWLAVLALLLPFYIVLTGGAALRDHGRAALVWHAIEKVRFALLAAGRGGGLPEWSVGAALLVARRLVGDLSILVLPVCAAGYISARASTARRALTVSCLLVPLISLTLLNPCFLGSGVFHVLYLFRPREPVNPDGLLDLADAFASGTDYLSMVRAVADRVAATGADLLVAVRFVLAGLLIRWTQRRLGAGMPGRGG